MIKDLFVVAFIADIHFGAMKSDQLYIQLQEYFLKVIDSKRIDMIVFGGDLFHNIITMNYSTSHIVLMFMENVINLCVKNGIPYIRIIQGTISHDNNQLHNFHMFENRSDVDFRIIMSVEEEHLVREDIKVLYIPEEYMRDPKEYYEDYLENADKKYDFIFGHGMVKEVAFIAKNQESENTMSKAPIFDSKQLINCCKGPIYFGHIHTHTVVHEHLVYPGSFSRFRFGEEEDKGWILCMYNRKTGKYISEFVENKLAPTYITVTVKLEGKYVDDPGAVEAVVNQIHADYIRLVCLIKEESSYAIQYLTELYKNNPSVKVQIKNQLQQEKEAAEQKLMDEVMDKYSFVFDKSLTTNQIIRKFIQVKYDKDVPLEIIDDELKDVEKPVGG